jgi:tRNA (guanine37-N1)-methyltransferase
MRVTVVTIFPELFAPFLATSIVGRALEDGRIEVRVADLRDYTDDPHRVVDDEPFGGGPGMVMTAPPWIRAVEDLASGATWRVLLSPQGRRLDDAKVRELAARQDILMLCARYEGVDERVKMSVVDEEISIGDYVVAGGDVPAMVLIEAMSRQIPGVVGSADSVEHDSFREGLLDHPHFTRPRQVRNLDVPDVLLSGHHAEISRWRAKEAAGLEGERRKLLAEVEAEEAIRAKIKG